MGHHRYRGARGARGQSVVEFALFLPIVVILMIAIVDLGRIYTTMLTVESAAREGADYGAFGSHKWAAGLYDLAVDGTEAKMELRACTAASELPDYAGPIDNCANPSFTYEISGDKGATWSAYNPAVAPWDSAPCDNNTRTPPCWVRVTLEYDFDVLVPLRLELFGTQLGIPDVLTFQRTSTFAITDIES